MTQTNILEKRQRTLQQRKNRLKQFESSVNELARKQRTRRLIELGGLAAITEFSTSVEAFLPSLFSCMDSGKMPCAALARE